MNKNKIALGSAQFGMPYGIANKNEKINMHDVESILYTAKNHGVDTLDTAIAYGNSEIILGEIGVSDWNIITKLPELPIDNRDVTNWVSDSIFSSLKRLRVESLYGLLLHQPEQLLQQDGHKIYEVLQKLKESGVIKKIGISIYGPEILGSIITNYSFDIVQAPYNIFDQRINESGWLSSLSDNNVEIHIRSIFLQGLLLMNKNKRPESFLRWQQLWEKWEKWLSDTGMNALEACVSHAVSNEKIDKVIVGVDSKEQLLEILKANRIKRYDIPACLVCTDIELIDPSRWNTA
jgi:aryl-alcohol dehydrogenase-like predicted oxidoreductase